MASNSHERLNNKIKAGEGTNDSSWQVNLSYQQATVVETYQ